MLYQLSYLATRSHETACGSSLLYQTSHMDATLDPSGVMPERIYSKAELTVWESLLYNMRHVQHHAAQLNLLLRQATNDAPRWVASTPLDL